MTLLSCPLPGSGSRPRLAPRSLALGAALLLAGLACTSDPGPDSPPLVGGQAGTGGAGRAPYDPAPFTDGRTITESAACKKLDNAFGDRVAGGCILTLLTCPGLLRASVDPSEHCAQYDLGALEGCLGYLSKLPCGELTATSCGPLPTIAGTATGDDSCLSSTGAGGSGGGAAGGAAGAGGDGGGQGGSAGAGAGGQAPGVGGASGSSGEP